MSDQQPASFGATVGQGEWGLFQDFLRNPANVSGIQKKLEIVGRRRVQEGEVELDSAHDRGGVARRGGSTRRGGVARACAATARAPCSCCPRSCSSGSGSSTRRSTRSPAASSAPSGVRHFVGIDNYKALFTTPTLTTAIKNNLIWVAVVPAFVTAIGLIFAVLTERVRLGVRLQDRGVPADGDLRLRHRVTWRIMYVTGPKPRRRSTLSDGRSWRSSSSPASLSTSAAIDSRHSQGNAQDGNGVEGAAAAGRGSPAGTDRDPARRMFRPRAKQAVVPASNQPRHRRGSCGGTSNRAAACPARSSPRELGLPGVTVAAAKQREQGRQDGSIR